jgi:hypothetical protein
MSNDGSSPPRRSRQLRVHSARRLLPVFLLAFFALAATAQAHNVVATSACTPGTAAGSGNSVTINWTNFANPPGPGNGGENTPGWQIVYTPTAGGAPVTLSGSVTFPLDSYSLTVAVPGGAGSLVVSSFWTAAETTDGNVGSTSQDLNVSDCFAAPAIATTASAGVQAGGTISDSAVLSGGRAPTGTITFNLYAAGDTTCSTSLATGTATVTGNGTYASPVVTENTAGSYQWVASYSGDANNKAIADACGQPAEQVVVTPPPTPTPTPTPSKASPTIVTTASAACKPTSTTTTCPLTDEAVLSGGNSPTGTITFGLYPSGTTCTTALKTVKATVAGNGSYTSPSVPELATGSYQWIASYSGDANNNPAAEPCHVTQEQVPGQQFKPVCTANPHLVGTFGKVGKSVTAHVTSLGVKSVTFYLDGRKLATVTKAHGGLFTIKIKTSGLKVGVHRITATTKMSQSICKPVSLSHSFIHPANHPPPPTPTG